jgi:hypothetical protein
MIMELNESINELRKIGLRAGQILYNICYRGAGVGIMWSDESRLRGKPLTGHNYKEVLYIESYYSSLAIAIESEIKRFKNLVIKEKCPECGRELDTIIELSNKCVSGGVLLCTSCLGVSPFAATTIDAMHKWEDREKE